MENGWIEIANIFLHKLKLRIFRDQLKKRLLPNKEGY